MRRLLILTAALWLAPFAPAFAATIHVPADQPTIQAGILAAADGDTVLVADGTYTGTGNRDIDLFGKSVTVISANGPAACIIDCQGSASDQHRGFIVHLGEGTDTEIRGFTIRNGFLGAGQGGAILCDGTSPTISGNVIIENHALDGGGIACLNGTPTISGNTVSENRVTGWQHEGAGIYCNNASPLITLNTISGNGDTDNCWGGGGIYCVGGAPEIDGNTISNNLTYGSGGGIETYLSDATITGNTVSGNQGGGGIFLWESTVHVEDNTITDNTRNFYWGGGICCYRYVTGTIIDNTISGNFAPFGGGIDLDWFCTVDIIGNTISGNCGYYTGTGISGGGLSLRQCAGGTVADNIVTGNRANNGGGIYIDRGNLLLSNNLVHDNESGTGGGFYIDRGVVTIEGSTIAGNRAVMHGGGLTCDDATVTMTNCILWNDAPSEISVPSGTAPTVSWSDVRNGYTGTGNIDADPLLIPGPFGSLCLGQIAAGQPAESPCVDAGDPTSAMFIGSTRTDAAQDTGIVDMGFHHPLTADLHICFAPEELTFTAAPGGPTPDDQVLEIWRCGSGTLSWTASETADWLSLWPESGDTAGEIDPVTVIVDPSGLAPGQHDAVITVAGIGAANTPREIPVVLIVSSGEVHVPGDHATIQAAVDAAFPGDEVIVADGTWSGEGNKEVRFNGKAITVRSANGPATCIIDCEGYGNGFRFDQWEGPDSVVRGFTVTNGYGYYYGGAVYCTFSTPVITGCVFTGNEGIYGGAIRSSYASPIIHGNTITNNLAYSDEYWYNEGGIGGGIYCSGSGSPVISSNIIAENSTSSYYGLPYDIGGGICCFDTSPLIVNNLIGNNESYDSGGIICYEGAPVLLNNTIVNNWSTAGAGVSFDGGEPQVTNCIVRDNTPAEIAAVSTTPLVTYCDVLGGYPGEGNFDADPIFVFGPGGGFYLSQTAAGQPIDSPCVDTGSAGSASICFPTAEDTNCFNELTTRTDLIPDTGTVDLGYHPPAAPSVATVSAELTCRPTSGTLPLTTAFTVTLTNLYSGQARRIAARLDLDLAGGQHYGYWRSGYTNVDVGGDYTASWNQLLPALGSLIGPNVFLLAAEDVTPAPWNQPPYPPAGHTDSAACTVTGIAP